MRPVILYKPIVTRHLRRAKINTSTWIYMEYTLVWTSLICSFHYLISYYSIILDGPLNGKSYDFLDGMITLFWQAALFIFRHNATVRRLISGAKVAYTTEYCTEHGIRSR